MKKIKKVLAMIMAMAMIMGLGMTAFAATPSRNDETTGTVSNVEYDARVTAYHIVEADYNTSGFIGYSVVDELGSMITDPLKPTANELAEIAKDVETYGLESKTMTTTASAGFGNFTADLSAGYWLVLVTGGKEVYNPMLLGVYYTGSGSDGTLTGGTVDADSNWTLESEIVYAKSSSIPITKTADVETQDLGDVVKFTIETKVPYYSDEYDTDTLVFTIKDSLTNLAMLIDGDHQVSVEAKKDSTDYSAVAAESYTSTAANDVKEFEIKFNSTWIKANGGADVRITYYATLEEGALNEIPGSNDAEVIYTNDPSNKTNSNKDTEKIYTFDIDGDVTADILKKVAPSETEGQNVALDGATFTLYTDDACNNVYTNTKHANGTAVSDSEGQIEFTGLAAGTYYLKETAAPNGYTLNDTVYEITITATIENEELTSWDVSVKDLTNNTTADSSFTVTAGTAVADGENETTEIMNTTISSLPSTGGIGTTIFTIGGIVIMVAAAGLYFANRRKNNAE